MKIEKCSRKRRLMIYIGNTIQYERHHAKEQENSHKILISIGENNKTIQLLSVYQTFKLSSTKTLKAEFADKLEVLRQFLNIEKVGLILGDLNLDYNKKGNLSNLTNSQTRRI
jgi:hypothetical protein